MLKCIIFDMDGVIAPTMEWHYQAWKEIMNIYGTEISEVIMEGITGVTRREGLEYICRHYDLSFSEEDKVKLMKEKNDLYLNMISSFDHTSSFPGTNELIHYFKNHGFLVALGSASQNAIHVLKALQLYDLFDYIVDASQFKSKPDPGIFLDARDHFDLLSAECLGIEDAKSGVEALIRAGINSVGIGHTSDVTKATIRFDSLYDFYLNVEEVIQTLYPSE